VFALDPFQASADAAGCWQTNARRPFSHDCSAGVRRVPIFLLFSQDSAQARRGELDKAAQHARHQTLFRMDQVDRHRIRLKIRQHDAEQSLLDGFSDFDMTVRR